VKRVLSFPFAVFFQFQFSFTCFFVFARKIIYPTALGTFHPYKVFTEF